MFDLFWDQKIYNCIRIQLHISEQLWILILNEGGFRGMCFRVSVVGVVDCVEIIVFQPRAERVGA